MTQKEKIKKELSILYSCGYYDGHHGEDSEEKKIDECLDVLISNHLIPSVFKCPQCEYTVPDSYDFNKI